MIRRDMADIDQIENALFCDLAWTQEEFVTCLRRPNTVGMTIENYDCETIGYMVYELHNRRIQLLNFAVDPGYHRKSVGRQMVEKLFAKLSHQRRTKIVAEVREGNLDALLFFRAMGFLAVALLKNEYEEYGLSDDTVIMEYHF